MSLTFRAAVNKGVVPSNHWDIDYGNALVYAKDLVALRTREPVTLVAERYPRWLVDTYPPDAWEHFVKYVLAENEMGANVYLLDQFLGDLDRPDLARTVLARRQVRSKELLFKHAAQITDMALSDPAIRKNVVPWFLTSDDLHEEHAGFLERLLRDDATDPKVLLNSCRNHVAFRTVATTLFPKGLPESLSPFQKVWARKAGLLPGPVTFSIDDVKHRDELDLLVKAGCTLDLSTVTVHKVESKCIDLAQHVRLSDEWYVKVANRLRLDRNELYNAEWLRGRMAHNSLPLEYVIREMIRAVPREEKNYEWLKISKDLDEAVVRQCFYDVVGPDNKELLYDKLDKTDCRHVAYLFVYSDPECVKYLRKHSINLKNQPYFEELRASTCCVC